MSCSVVRTSLYLFLLGVSAPAQAGDSILGLPAPQDPKHPGAVVLHGGGRITEDAFARFIELAGGKRARIVLVPSAGYRAVDYESRKQFLDVVSRRFSSWVRLASRGRISHFEFLHTDEPDDANDADFIEPLQSATGVWFSGGAQTRLNYRYVGYYPRQTRFQNALRQILARGGVVGGTSAGMAALPEIMTLYQVHSRSSSAPRVVAAHGLGLLTGAIVEQHFDGRAGRLERFTDLLRDSSRLDRLAGRRGAGPHMLGLAVDGSTALVLQDDRLEVLGASSAHIFLKSLDRQTVSRHTLDSGDRAMLKRAGPGQVILSRAP
jgi:cyanophycinase